MLRRKFILSELERFFKRSFIFAFLDDLHEHRIIYLFSYLKVRNIELHVIAYINKLIAYDLCNLSLIVRALHHYEFNAGILYLHGKVFVYLLILFGEDLSRVRIYYVFCRYNSCEPVGNAQFFIVLVSSHLSKIVSLRVKEHGIEQ